MLNCFIRCNRAICNKIENLLPLQFKKHLFTSYKYLVAQLIDQTNNATVLDIGGGKECPYLPFTRSAGKQRIISMDIAENELRQNNEVSLKVVADAAGVALPFLTASADIITSRSVLEHVYDNSAFLRNCRRVLRPGGYLISAFPCRFSPFAILNKLLPDHIARGLLYLFHPEWRDECGFKVFYDQCSYREMCELLERNGFEITHFELRYYQAIYYDFFVPFYLIMLFYDLVVWGLDLRGLSCQMLFFARVHTPRAS